MQTRFNLVISNEFFVCLHGDKIYNTIDYISANNM